MDTYYFYRVAAKITNALIAADYLKINPYEGDLQLGDEGAYDNTYEFVNASIINDTRIVQLRVSSEQIEITTNIIINRDTGDIIDTVIATAATPGDVDLAEYRKLLSITIALSTLEDLRSIPDSGKSGTFN